MSEVDNSHTPQEKTPDKYTYAILQETSGEENESWLYFIRYQGNEKALQHLQDQLSKVEWYILDNLSTFDLELDYLVSESTAKDMTKVDLNHTSHHRKFDGRMKEVDLKFKSKDSAEKMMSRAFDKLGYGQIEDYVSDEDIDPEDLVDASGESDTQTESSSESEPEEKTTPRKKLGKLPASLLEKPRLARARQGKKKH